MAQELTASSSHRTPYSLEAEQSLLGAILIDPERIRDVLEKIKSDDFYFEKNKFIYEAMQSLFLQSRNIDIVTLLDMLTQSGEYDEAGGKSYIMTLSEAVPTAANIVDYAKIIHEKSLLRKLITAADEISEMAYAAEGDTDTIIDSAEQKIFNIASDTDSKDFVHIRDSIVQQYAHLKELINDKEASMGLATGFSDIDKYIVGMGKGDLIIVGARPGMGKTAFCLNIAANVASKKKQTVAIFSLEMSNEQLVSRMLSAEAYVDSYKMRTGELDSNDWTNLARAAAVLSETNILYDDNSGITITGMKAKLRRVKNLGLVIVDYLGLMHSERNIDNRVQEISEISRNLKLLAKDLGVPVIVCSQLNRGVESQARKEKMPLISDLRDSGSIEQDADIIMFLYRDEYYSKDPSKQNVAQCSIAKNRHGATGTVDLGWYGQFTKFITVDKNHES